MKLIDRIINWIVVRTNTDPIVRDMDENLFAMKDEFSIIQKSMARIKINIQNMARHEEYLDAQYPTIKAQFDEIRDEFAAFSRIGKE